ncbi:TMhelix containing protein [Vibrio phage 1.072.O._10N.286.48.A12]|nr:TMhelix containing protein [Vibrio phage 1.004.O._10N.261.54.A2]AUR83595.1 TMhelix containing protein [Vibrio phage 1.037.O._10N.261.52.F7]AUR84480.1 TMhelix containing protein [Vibrio phage 1.056.O._10N.261.48.C11]AUR84997.1 TMhelix containing protein [Vibrio phage 1.066.O._10N.286.46.E8]AUR85128.1 TMhelix containing protein [Vibrio phage 1.068.O._10N.261.51.F8]AUR85353.1 TMhelix containing protein [Vibrio phage 1.072.O._10N.286.48.A12]
MEGKMQSRKLWLALGALILVTAMMWFDKVTSTEFIEFIKWNLAIYAAGNVGAKFGAGKQ